MNKRYKKEVESSCEYVLPDYMGDIKKILSSRAVCTPAGKLITDGGVEITGMVEYEILYADSENRLTAIAASSDYSVTVPTESDNYVDCFQQSRVGNLNIRITGPRKVSLRCGVEVSATITSEANTEVGGDAFSLEQEPEHITRIINAENSIYGKSIEREYAEEGERLRDVAAEEIEIISTSGNVRVMDVRAVDGGVEIKGELIIAAIVRTPEQAPFAIRRAIAFEEIIEIDGAVKDMQAVADGYVTSAVCGIGEDGDETIITVNAIVEYEAHVLENESVNLVTDAYALNSEVINEYMDLEYNTLGACQINELVVTGKISRESIGCAECRDILTLNADVRSSSAEVCAGGVEYRGDIAISGVACEINVDGSVSYVPIKATVPFEQKVNINCQIPEKSTVEYVLLPVLCEGSFDSDDLHVRCIIKTKTKLCISSFVRCLSSCTIGEDLVHDVSPSRITVYYPVVNDTLFSVAKRFHTTSVKLCCDNSIESAVSATDSPDSLAGVRKLIIR